MTFRPGKHQSSGGDRSERIRADACVLGAGAGGCAAALALAEAGLKVILLDAGWHWNPSDFQASPPWALRNLYHRRGVEVAMGREGVIPLAQGRGVGGSTLINSAICFRPPPDRLAHWRDVSGFDPDSVIEPLANRVWQSIGATVNPPAVQRENNLIMKRGVDTLGWKGDFMHRSAPGCVGCGVCQFGCPTGGKLSVDRSLLAEALSTELVAVYGGYRVEDAEVLDDGVVAVEGALLDPVTDEPAGHFRVEADRFIVSGGCFGSPRFLLENRLADEEHCGNHLHLHPAVGAVALFEHEIRPWEGVTQGYYVDRSEHGYLLETFTVTPDQHYLNMPLAKGETDLKLIASLKNLASCGVMGCGFDSEGRVSKGGTTYRLSPLDRRRLLAGLRDVAVAYLAAGATHVYPAVAGIDPITRADEVDTALSLEIPTVDLSVYASHLMGTCRTGTHPDNSVVDGKGRVWGWNKLYVADASVFPGSLAVNPQVTIMATGLAVGATAAQL